VAPAAGDCVEVVLLRGNCSVALAVLFTRLKSHDKDGQKGYGLCLNFIFDCLLRCTVWLVFDLHVLELWPQCTVVSLCS